MGRRAGADSALFGGLGGVSLHVPLGNVGGCGLFHLLFQRVAIASQLRSGGLDGRARCLHHANGAVCDQPAGRMGDQPAGRDVEWRGRAWLVQRRSVGDQPAGRMGGQPAGRNVGRRGRAWLALRAAALAHGVGWRDVHPALDQPATVRVAPATCNRELQPTTCNIRETFRVVQSESCKQRESWKASRAKRVVQSES